MNVMLKADPNRVYIFNELKKRRFFVGEIRYLKDSDVYELIYDEKYASSDTAIPLGPTLDLINLHHFSEKGKMFPIFLDRIPDRENPAYEDYCDSQGISVEETNPIILLGTIGTRGPSTFIFELVYEDEFSPEQITLLRQQLNITQHDWALAFDISKPTLQRIEAGLSHDANTIKRLSILFHFPEVALWQLRQTGMRVHWKILASLKDYFESRHHLQKPQ